MSYARFTTSSKLPVLLGCLKAAFERLGIPAEILVDNMKQAVESHDVATGAVRWNRTFLDFADHHGFLPVACPPYWPQAKGKVERGIGYIKKSFLEGRRFTDLENLNRQLEVWFDTVANVCDHGTTASGRSTVTPVSWPRCGPSVLSRSMTPGPSSSGSRIVTATSATPASTTASIRWPWAIP